jgi:SAM-dependent methyltransferase
MQSAGDSRASWQGHEGRRLDKQGEYDVISCETCGFAHVVPVPTPEVLEAAYQEAYYRDEKPAYLTHAQEDQEWARLAQTDRLEIFERVLGPGRRRLLDIGSGPGFFLKTAQDRGWTVLGIDFSRQACAHARGLGVSVVEGWFDAESAPKLGKFDAIHFGNVMEHLADPAAILDLIRERLDAGGLVCINVPNDFSPIQKATCHATGVHSWWVEPRHHLNYFTFESLEALLAKHGFEPVERTTSFPMEMFQLLGEDYIRQPKLGRECHKKRVRFDLAFEAAGVNEARRAFYHALASVGAGRDAVVVARRR